MNLVTATSQAIKEAGAVIRDGGLVAFPTETVYGLGADALNPLAVVRIFEVKNRPSFDPLIVHISELSYLEKLSSSIDRKARKLIERFWPGPLTIVVAKRDTLPDIVTAGLSTVAIRMPDHPVALNLIREAKTPISAPSANPFGYLSPTTAEQVKEQLGDKIDVILDNGKTPLGIESTVIDLTGQLPIILRPGGVPVEEIEEIIGDIKISKGYSKRPHSPGQFPRHYSPRTPIKVLNSRKLKTPKKAGLLAFKSPQKKLSYKIVEVLSSSGDLREAAANLFSSLHKLDKAGLDIIFAEPLPETGLGRAIMDRLHKAEGG